MNGYVINIEQATRENENFRMVLYTAKHSQLVVMSLKPSEEIGKEVHHLDQCIRIESGRGIAILNGVEHEIEAGFAVIVPASIEHNIVNTSKTESLKLSTVYSPPNHRDGVIHITKEEAEADEEDHFDGVTSEK